LTATRVDVQPRRQTPADDGPADGLGAMVGGWWCGEESKRRGVPLIEVEAVGHTVYVIMCWLAQQVGIDRANPHRFRYTFATWAIASGAREIDVQLLLGHSSPQMTQHYARAYDSHQAVQAHAAFSPVAQLTSTPDSMRTASLSAEQQLEASRA